MKQPLNDSPISLEELHAVLGNHPEIKITWAPNNRAEPEIDIRGQLDIPGYHGFEVNFLGAGESTLKCSCDCLSPNCPSDLALPKTVQGNWLFICRRIDDLIDFR